MPKAGRKKFTMWIKASSKLIERLRNIKKPSIL